MILVISVIMIKLSHQLNLQGAQVKPDAGVDPAADAYAQPLVFDVLLVCKKISYSQNV